jgi:acetolactate synthase-1/3 small subunit
MSVLQQPIQSHILSVLVDNEPGILARVVGLFSGRGYNIESLTVAEVSDAAHLSRITVVTSGPSNVIDQIKAQLGRLVPVHNVHDLTVEGPHIARELALIKVAAPARSVSKACVSPISSVPVRSTAPRNPSFSN